MARRTQRRKPLKETIRVPGKEAAKFLKYPSEVTPTYSPLLTRPTLFGMDNLKIETDWIKGETKDESNIHRSTLEVVQGDITQQDTEAIGNAANSALAGGGGVDGAIHGAGGPTLMSELRAKYKGCPTGFSGYYRRRNLKAQIRYPCSGTKILRVTQGS